METTQAKQRPAVLITGVSTGIGFDTARELIAHGFRILGSVRKVEDGTRVKDALGEHFTPLFFDVTDADAIARAVPQVQAIVGTAGLAGLVNNAGVAPTAPLMHMPMEEFQRCIDINVFGVLRVTQAFLPLLGARKNCPHPPGRIVNLSSISGGVAFPLVGAYACSKHALEAMTDALRRELGIYGIQVVAIEPGSIQTPIWEKAQAIDPRYAATDYADVMAKMPEFSANENRKGKPVTVVSAAIRDALTSPRPKTRYPLTALWTVRKLVPTRVLDHIARKTIGLTVSNP
jgi:NAD(P)-dependent dehydrogenase (short-subunit alcohol dehydrogenase family)